MRTGTPEQAPAPDARKREAPPAGRSTRAQQALLVIVGAGLLAGLCLWLANMRVRGVLAFIVAAIAGLVFLRGTGSARDKRSEGPGMVNFRQLIFWRTDGEPPPQAQQDGGPPLNGQGGLPQGYPPGTQGHPFHGPKGQHRGRKQVPVEQAATVASSPAGNATGLTEPPVFVGPSTPGQAPWHLPVGAAPSGLAADGIRLGDLEVRAASMVGAGHRCEEPAVPRQDAYALGRTRDGNYLVIAVADGVGNSRHADLAARVAVNAAARELVRAVESGGPGAVDAGLIYTQIAGEIVGTGRDRGIPDADVCAILITAVIPTTTRPDGTRPMWASWIGDVSLWIGRGGELHRSTGQDKTGLDRNALQAVLPFNPDQVEHRTVELHPHDRVALMTDGVSDSLVSVDGTMDYFARQWAGPPPHPAAFLHSLCYDGPGQTDDRTAVVVWCSTTNPGTRRSAGEGR